MAEEISVAEFARLVARAGLTLDPERFEELRQGHQFIERLTKTVRLPPRDRSAEPAHIFIHPRG